jgi:hypothetical protein
MSADMEFMTPEERVAYVRAGAEEALRQMPKISLEESRKRLSAILHPERAPTPAAKAKSATKPSSRRRKAAKSLANA